MTTKSSNIAFACTPDVILRLEDASVYLKLTKSELLRGMLLRYLNEEIEPAMRKDNWQNNLRSANEILNQVKT